MWQLIRCSTVARQVIWSNRDCVWDAQGCRWKLTLCTPLLEELLLGKLRNKGWKQRILEWMLVRQSDVGWAGFGVRILESIHVVSVGKKLCKECLRWVNKWFSGILGKLKSNVDFSCRRCLEEGAGKTVSQREIEPYVKLECFQIQLFGSHLVQEEVWMRQLEWGCDVLGLSSRSYCPFWQPVVHHKI